MAVQLDPPELGLASFGSSNSAGGWTSYDQFPRVMADVNGDGQGDIVGFGGAGVYVALSGGNGLFGAPTFELAAFGSSAGAGGWASDSQFPREAADVNGDGRDDIVGFGAAGTYVSLAQADGTFAAPTFELAAFGTSTGAGGWSSFDQFPRQLADVNGDTRADIVGFASNGTYVALGQTDGSFAAPKLAIASFGANGSAGGWSSFDQFPRELADVNGDGRHDIVGFGAAGTYVSLAQADGTFAAPTLALASFGSSVGAGGWSSDNQFPRELADMNGDGREDIVGFGGSGVYISLAQADGTFAAPTFELASFGSSTSAGGWSSFDQYPRELADVTGDGSADIVGFGAAGTYVSQSHSDLLI